MVTNRLSFVLIFSAFFLVAGCGGGDGEAGSASTASEETAQSEDAVTAPLGTASITGTVNFSGEAPARRPIRQDPECNELNSEPVMTKSVIVNENGTLKNAFVYVKEGLGEYNFSTPSDAVVFDQRGCTYQPHVFGVQTGQPIKILNSDPLLHNIHALPEENRGFNFGMPNQGDERERTFLEHEVMVRIKCDVHPWMSAYAGVLEHPYFFVTGNDGSFVIDGLAAGDYVVEVWHEEYGRQTANVTVTDGEAAMTEFTYDGSAG